MARRVGLKNLFCDQKFKIDKIFSKFLEIWTEGPSSSASLSQRRFGQDLKWIRPFLTFQCPPGACSLVAESLSRSLDVLVSIMVLQGVCQLYTDIYVVKIRVWCMFSMPNVPNGNGGTVRNTGQ